MPGPAGGNDDDHGSLGSDHGRLETSDIEFDEVWRSEMIGTLDTCSQRRSFAASAR